MNIDEAIEKLQLDMAKTINESGLPLSIVDLVLERVVNEVKTTMVRMKQERAAEESKEKEPKEKTKSK